MVAPGLFGENQLALARAPQAVGLALMGNLHFAAAAEQGSAVQRARRLRATARRLGLGWCRGWSLRPRP